MKAGEIKVKDIDILRGLMERNFNPLLINIILDIADTYGVVITESYREKKHRNDLHGTNPVRAIDIRWWEYSDMLAKKINNDINIKWIYDPHRPEKTVSMIHAVEGGTKHFHIQCHPRTRRR